MKKESAHVANYGKDRKVFGEAVSLGIKNGKKYEEAFTKFFRKANHGSSLTKEELNEFIKSKTLPSRSSLYIIEVNKRNKEQKLLISTLNLGTKAHPDHIVIDNSAKIIYIFQEKSSAQLDTTNGPGSVAALTAAALSLTTVFGMIYTIKQYLVGWTVKDNATLLSNMKGYILTDKAMTGREVCQTFNIKYDDIVNAVSPKETIKINQKKAAELLYANIGEETSIAKYIIEMKANSAIDLLEEKYPTAIKELAALKEWINNHKEPND